MSRRLFRRADHPSGGGKGSKAADTGGMEAAAPLTASGAAEWRVQRDGSPFATVATHQDGHDVVVSTRLYDESGSAERIRPYRFPDRDAADSFVRDLVASFSYLGCQVAQA